MGTIESKQTERRPLLESRPNAPSTPRGVGGALGNLGPAATIVTAYPGASRPSLEMPRIEVGSDGSIKLVLPTKIAANESLAKEFTTAIYRLFFSTLSPPIICMRELKDSGLDNLYVEEAGPNREKADTIIASFNGFIQLLEICGVTSQDFLSAALQFNHDYLNKGDIPTLEEFLTRYLCLNAKPDNVDSQATMDRCNHLAPAFNRTFEWLSARSAAATNLKLGYVSLTALDIALTGRAIAKQNFEALGLYVVLNHQQSWLSRSGDLDHLEMAAGAAVLLHEIYRRTENRAPTPPDPSDLIAALADRAVKAVGEENLPDADRCADCLAKLTQVSEEASARLAEVKAVIAEYDAQAEAVAAEVGFDA